MVVDRRALKQVDLGNQAIIIIVNPAQRQVSIDGLCATSILIRFRDTTLGY